MANEDDKKFGPLWKAVAELREKIAALADGGEVERNAAEAFELMDRRLAALERGSAGMADPETVVEPGVECPTLPVKQGAIVIYHSELGDFPAIAVRDRIIRAGFPPRYTLFALYDRGGQNTYANFERGVVEGDGMGEFTR